MYILHLTTITDVMMQCKCM